MKNNLCLAVLCALALQAGAQGRADPSSTAKPSPTAALQARGAQHSSTGSPKPSIDGAAAARGHLHVAPGGSDANSGAPGQPLKTIARADELARPGDTIHVAPGLYRFSAPSPMSAGIRTAKNGTPDAPIAFVSDVQWGAKIVFSGAGIAWRSKGAHVRIEGFDISGAGRMGILAEGGHAVIARNLVHDLQVIGGCNGSGGAGIDIAGPVGDAIVDSNVVRNIGVRWTPSRSCNTAQGIYVANPNNRVSNNLISGAAAVGVNSWHGATRSTIVNNTIFNSKMGIVIGHGDSGATAAGTRDNHVANNIVYDNAFGIVEMGVVGGNNRYHHNLVFNNGQPWRVKGVVDEPIAEDPRFVDYRPDGLGDYRLKLSSPAIDRGQALPQGRLGGLDLAGAPRTQGAGVDLGAYEFAQAPPATPPIKCERPLPAS